MPGGQHARQRLDGIAGAPPDPADLPAGCRFAPRCGFAVAACQVSIPPLVAVTPDQESACVRATELRAQPVAA
jgi:oligopeptide/dipeptide ABC transporter ATP-binding protein